MKSYILDDGQGTRAVILPEKGATAVSLCRNGVEFLYRDDENLQSPERPRCGIPFLFPIFGRLKEGKYRWDGAEYAMEIHGFGHTSPWQITSQTENTLHLTLKSTEDTLTQYPFVFRVSLLFSLEDGALTIAQKYENLDDRPMPYNYGFHPYFLTEKPEDIRVETTADTFFDFAVGGKPFGHGSIRLTMPDGAPETGRRSWASAVPRSCTGPTESPLPWNLTAASTPMCCGPRRESPSCAWSLSTAVPTD